MFANCTNVQRRDVHDKFQIKNELRVWSIYPQQWSSIRHSVQSSLGFSCRGDSNYLSPMLEIYGVPPVIHPCATKRGLSICFEKDEAPAIAFIGQGESTIVLRCIRFRKNLASAKTGQISWRWACIITIHQNRSAVYRESICGSLSIHDKYAFANIENGTEECDGEYETAFEQRPGEFQSTWHQSIRASEEDHAMWLSFEDNHDPSE